MSNGPFYVGVDQSLTSPGVAVIGGDGRACFADTISVARDMRGGERLAHIEGELERILKPYVLGLQRCAMEGASYGSVHREFDLGEVSGVVRAYLYTVTHREALIVTPTLLKKFATGNGLATKEDVLHAVKTVYGHDCEGRDDVADAFVLARISRAHASPKILTRRCELEVLRTLATPAKSRPKPKTAKSL